MVICLIMMALCAWGKVKVERKGYDILALIMNVLMIVFGILTIIFFVKTMLDSIFGTMTGLTFKPVTGIVLLALLWVLYENEKRR